MIQLVKRFSQPFLFASIIAAIHFGLWVLSNQALPLISVKPILHGFAYSAYRADQSPLEKTFPSTAELAQDLKLIKKYSNRIRIYASLENSEVITLAEKQGISVIAGAWINKDQYANAREIAALKEKIVYYDN